MTHITQFPTTVLTLGLSPRAVLAYALLFTRGRKVAITQSELATTLNVNARQIQRVLLELREKGLISVQLQREKCKPSIYWVNQPHAKNDASTKNVVSPHDENVASMVDVFVSPDVADDVSPTDQETLMTNLSEGVEGAPPVKNDVADTMSITDVETVNGSTDLDLLDRVKSTISKIDQYQIPVDRSDLDVLDPKIRSQVISDLERSIDLDLGISSEGYESNDHACEASVTSTPVKQPEVAAPPAIAQSELVVDTPSSSSAKPPLSSAPTMLRIRVQTQLEAMRKRGATLEEMVNRGRALAPEYDCETWTREAFSPAR